MYVSMAPCRIPRETPSYKSNDKQELEGYKPDEIEFVLQ
jgi:hypothetical protein